MSKRAKWSIGIIALIAVVAVVGLSAAKRGNKGVEVRTEEVQARDLVASVTASGQVQPRMKVDVSADVTGRIVRLAVKEGQMVTRGQFLLQIDPAQAEAAVQRSVAAVSAARAQEAQARANFQQAKNNYERTAEIRKANPQLVSDEQLEQLRTQVEVTEALAQAALHQVAQSEATLRDARSSLGKTTILAPMSGRITRLAVEQGETAIMGTLNKDAALLLTISDMNVLETKVKVDETDVARLSLGDSAVVEIDAFPDTTFIGRVVEIANSAIRTAAGQQSDQAIDYEVTVELANAPPDTRPDFSATAKIITDMRQQALSIPIIALTTREREQTPNADSAQVVLGRQPSRQVGKRDIEGVFIVNPDNTVSFRQVKIGIAGDEYFEVVDGLKAGEKIVSGSFQAIRELKDGGLIREQPQRTASAGTQEAR
ncbi:MAG TPA: efflux RND transporter periplasmic adaptor subunit [Gemmatimonadaceae bacterium]|nr:efflux RND transporter periplasmic adaptor subunit [Gemmatimonadaceae bacterium]